MKQIIESPINKNKLISHISCEDYTVSRETFSIYIDENSELLVTTPRPEDDELDSYYESENYISHSNTNKSILDKVYQLVRIYTVRQKVKIVNSFNQAHKTILDIGSGTGKFLEVCASHNWEVTGIEPNNKARSIAIKKLQLSKNIYKSIEDLKRNGHLTKLRTYDVITMWHVLEHVPNLNEYVRNLKQMLNPNGTLVIAVPNYKSFDALYYKKYWAAYDVPRHLWHFSKLAINNLFQQAGMNVVQILPMKFDSYYVSLLSEKYKTGKVNYFKAIYIGWRSNFSARSTKEYSSNIYIIKNDNNGF